MELDYDLELDKVAAEIKKLKDNSRKVQLYIWAGSNFGACDVPIQLKDMDFDLVVNFGHTMFRRPART